jgi:transcriptional antiterminator RfaH
MTADSLSTAKPVWLVVNTQTHREAIAANNLRKQGYEVYAPVVRKQTRHARRVYEVAAPLFPGYVFVQWRDCNMRWRPILSTVGVRTIVCNGDEPSSLSETVIEALKIREKDGVIVRPASPRNVGHIVRLARGPLEGIAGEIIALGEKDRLVVLMSLLNRPIKVTVSEDQLAAC